MKVGLNLGCGKKLKKSTKKIRWINIDLVSLIKGVIVKDILNLNFEEASVDKIELRHILEHFTEEAIDKILKDCYFFLKIGGEIVIYTPDFSKLVMAWNKKILSKSLICKLLFGYYASEKLRERKAYMWHKFIFDKESLVKKLCSAGFIVQFCQQNPGNKYKFNTELLLVAKKRV